MPKDLREIAHLVAVHVMEWRPWASPVSTDGEPDCWLTGDEDSPTMRMRDWNPAEEIADAWQVVEKMASGGWLPSLEHERGEWVCHMGHWAKDAGYASDKSAQLAVCLAALDALGVEVPEDA